MSLEEVKGIGPITSEKLIEAGIKTVDELSVRRPEEIKEILGVTLKKAKEIILSAKDLAFKDFQVFTAEEYKEKEKEISRFLDTGSNKLNSLLGGGWKSQSTYGIYGPFSTGKTQLCYTAVVNCVDQGYYAFWIETEPNTVYIPRLEEIAKNRDLNLDLNKVIVIPASKIGTIFSQFRAYEFLRRKAEEEKWDVGLLVVDSFTAKFRRNYSGREMYPERAREFGRHIDYLEEFSKRFNSVVLLTFQVGVTPDAPGQREDLMRFQSEYYPYGGTLVQHNINVWLSLNQVKGGAKSMDIYELNLVDHSYLPKGSIRFMITDRGIEDAL